MTSDAVTSPDMTTRPVSGSAPPRRRRTFKTWFRQSGGRHLVAVAASLFALYPVVWIISASFNAQNSLSSSRLIPRETTFDNFTEIFDNDVSPISTWMWNSFYIGFIAASLNVLVAAFAAYSFSRMEFRGRRALLTSLLVMQIFPQFLGFIAFFVLSQDFGDVWSAIGYNTHAFLILVYIGGAAGFNAFLLKGFLDSVPKSLDEAARIDGAGQLTIFFRIIMPLARPMLAVIFIISFITIFGEFVLASFLLSSTDNYTLPIGLQVFLAEGFNAKWGLLSATALVGALPIVVVFIFAQKHIIGGLTAGGVKG
jgi:arabinogalactan oligomer/maltooligosaccharide transport system permease protein